MKAATSPGKLWRSASAMVGSFLSHAGWSGVRAAALVATSALLEGAGLLMLVPILQVVMSQGGEGSAWLADLLARLGATTLFAQLAVLLAGFVLLTLLRALTLYARDMTLGRLQASFVEAERNRAMRALANASWSSVVGMRHARVTSALTTEVQRVGQVVYFLVQGGVTLAMLFIQAVLAFALSPALAAVAASLLLLGVVVFVLTHGKVRDLGVGVVRRSQALMGSATGLLGGLKAAAAQQAQAGFVAEFEKIQRELRAGQIEFQRRQARTRLGFALVSGVLGATLVLLGVGVLAVPAPILITLVLIFVRMSGPAMQLQQSAQQFIFALPGFEALRALEAELTAQVPVRVDGEAPPPGPVEFRGGTYLHPGGGGIADASFTLAPGAFAGIAGPSGAGKTTLVDLLVGLIEPQAGAVLVGGVPLDAAHVAGWRRSIAYVPQDGFLFHDTVRRNLEWGNDAPDDAAIAEALALAGADTVVARLEHGLETVVGERGALLSGGERQRLAIARALLRRPRLLVLDEAANAIDAPGEAALLGRLAALDPRPTIVMISHREESLRWCDQVIRIDTGRIVG